MAHGGIPRSARNDGEKAFSLKATKPIRESLLRDDQFIGESAVILEPDWAIAG